MSNPQVTVESVHIRYEQTVQSHPEEHPFAIGLLLSSFSAQLDTQGSIFEQDDVKSTSRVKVLMHGCSVYCMPVSKEGSIPRQGEQELVMGANQGKLQSFHENHNLFFEQQARAVSTARAASMGRAASPAKHGT